MISSNTEQQTGAEGQMMRAAPLLLCDVFLYGAWW